MTDKPVRTHEPHDRLTRLTNVMVEALEQNDEYEEDVKGIVMLSHGDRNGIALTGWEDDSEAMVYLFMHLRAIFEANGKELQLMTEDGVFI